MFKAKELVHCQESGVIKRVCDGKIMFAGRIFTNQIIEIRGRGARQGVLGVDFLSQFHCSIDFRTNKRISLTGWYCEACAACPTGSSKRYSDITVDGKTTIKALIDTGARRSYILYSEARKLGCDLKSCY